MIFQFFLDGLFGLILWFLSLIPEMDYNQSLIGSISALNESVRVLFYFVTPVIGSALIITTAFWLILQPSVSLLKFIYRKIPGVT